MVAGGSFLWCNLNWGKKKEVSFKTLVLLKRFSNNRVNMGSLILSIYWVESKTPKAWISYS